MPPAGITRENVTTSRLDEGYRDFSLNLAIVLTTCSQYDICLETLVFETKIY